ncbi:hypothetical protein [Sulfurisphaera javensis]|uniref:hypothetical protein n=1 Tax=Sulfurisphaera javensis TaxID=2049879 RepID=UPI0034E83C87
MSSIKDSFSISKMIKIYDVPIDFSESVSLIYDEDTELEAITLERSLIALKSTFVKSVNIYDFSFLENPYSGNFKDVIIFVNDENKAKIILDNVWALENKGYLITCNSKIKGKGQVNVLHFSPDELCEVNVSLSLLKKVSSFINNERSKDLLRELNSLDNLNEWILSKVKEINFNSEIFLSPVFFPAITLMSKILDKNVKRFYEKPSSKDVIFITTGVDAIVVRKREFELRNSNLNVKEILLDIDPLLAPIYLILMTYLFKRVNGE